MLTFAHFYDRLNVQRGEEMKAKVTIQDIADALGISRNTVSKAINNSEGIAAATRDRILEKAVEMGYKQFSYVQAMTESGRDMPQKEAPAPGSAGEIGLLTSFQFGGSHYAVTMLDRLRQELGLFGFTIDPYYVNPQELKQLQLPYPLPKKELRALICIEMFDWAYNEMLCDLDLPVLFVDGPSIRCVRKLRADQLLMDNSTDLRRFITALLRQGKTRIGFIGNIDHCQSFFERYMALRSGLLLAGVAFDEALHINNNHPIDVYHAISTMEQLPDLFICANDYIAIDAIRILKKLGKSVPEDVMICGFDDTAESRLVKPALTTVHIHTQIMAYTAAQMLISRIREPSLDFRRVYTQTDLMLRDSAPLADESL